MADRTARAQASQRGAALVVTMTALALLSSITALALLHARSDFLIHHRSHAALAAFATAEAGMTLALADLRRDARFSRLSAVVGGPYPFAVAPPEFFPEAPSHFTVLVEPRGADSVDVIAIASGIDLASARIAVTVRQDETPFVPAALNSQAAPPSLILGTDFHIAGGDAVPGIGLADADAVRALQAVLDSSTAAQIDGDPPIGTSGAGFGAALFDRVAAAAATLPAEVAGAVGRGIFLAPTSLHVQDATAAGILVVDGDLSIDGSFQFEGIAIVRGDVSVAIDSDVRFTGAMLQLAPGSSLHLRGIGELRYDAAILRALDSDYAGMLERRVVIAGWRDDS